MCVGGGGGGCHTLTIVMSSMYFGSDVVWSSTEGGGGVSWSQTLLTHAIVSQLNVEHCPASDPCTPHLNNNHTPLAVHLSLLGHLSYHRSGHLYHSITIGHLSTERGWVGGCIMYE